MLFNNPQFVDYLAKHFIGVASDDVAYNHLPEEAKNKKEYQFLKTALNDGGRSIHQGVYAVTSSGRFLGKIDTGWPTYDAEASLENLQKATATYKSMGKKERIRGEEMGDSDRSMPVNEGTAAKGVLKMRTMTRSYAFGEMELFDQRHPVYAKLDAFWLTSDEAKSLRPPQCEMGEKSYVAPSLVERLLLHSQPMEGCGGWWKEHIRTQRLKVTVSHVKGARIFLLYQGELAISANSQWNKSDYSGQLLGKGVWDENLQEFTQLDWLTLGERTLHELKSNMHRGNTKKTMIAGYMRLAHPVKEEQDLLPHHWDHYPQSFKQP